LAYFIADGAENRAGAEERSIYLDGYRLRDEAEVGGDLGEASDEWS
jgi:hypothetical protein